MNQKDNEINLNYDISTNFTNRCNSKIESCNDLRATIVRALLLWGLHKEKRPGQMFIKEYPSHTKIHPYI
jgi:hypothetical protein